MKLLSEKELRRLARKYSEELNVDAKYLYLILAETQDKLEESK